MKHHVIWVLTYDIEYNNVLVGANTFNHHYFTVHEGTLTGLYHGLALRMKHELGSTCTDKWQQNAQYVFYDYCHVLPPYISLLQTQLFLYSKHAVSKFIQNGAITVKVIAPCLN